MASRVLAERVSHHHSRPPVVVRHRTERAISPLTAQRPINPFLRLLLQPGIVERVGESDQTFDVIRPFFPILRIFSGPTQPAAVGTEARDHLLGVAGETITLQLQFREQPARGTHIAQRQGDEWIAREAARDSQRPGQNGHLQKPE